MTYLIQASTMVFLATFIVSQIPGLARGLLGALALPTLKKFEIFLSIYFYIFQKNLSPPCLIPCQMNKMN